MVVVEEKQDPPPSPRNKLPQIQWYFSWSTSAKKETKEGWKPTRVTNLITTAAGAQVITGVKRSPAGPGGQRAACSLFTCAGVGWEGGLCHFADCRWTPVRGCPTSRRRGHQRHGSISANHRRRCRNYLVVFDIRGTCASVCWGVLKNKKKRRFF